MSEQGPFDPYAILDALERHQVAYVLIGGLARVLHGSDEVTRGVDVTPALRPSNLQRLKLATVDLGTDITIDSLADPATLATPVGELKLIPQPAGTNGYPDLRRRAERQPIGQGLRPPVAAPGELVRMLEAFGRQNDLPKLHALHRVIELDRGRGIEL